MDEKFIPYEKMSAKERRKLDAKQRRSWDGFDPATRVRPSGKVYKRSDKHKCNELNWYSKLR